MVLQDAVLLKIHDAGKKGEWGKERERRKNTQNKEFTHARGHSLMARTLVKAPPHSSLNSPPSTTAINLHKLSEGTVKLEQFVLYVFCN